MVIVPDYQLSLAIGKEGQNARLAARLTGWRIDIKSETQVADEARAATAAAAAPTDPVTPTDPVPDEAVSEPAEATVEARSEPEPVESDAATPEAAEEAPVTE